MTVQSPLILKNVIPNIIGLVSVWFRSTRLLYGDTFIIDINVVDLCWRSPSKSEFRTRRRLSQVQRYVVTYYTHVL